MSLGNQSDRRPADSCLWYVLATVAGEPGTSTDFEAIVERNRRYWNGLMRDRIRAGGGAVVNGLTDNIPFPRLTDQEQEAIRTALDERGFRNFGLPAAYDSIDFSYLDFPDMTCFDGFVFMGRTSFDGARFAGGLTDFRDATFVEQATFRGTEFCGDLLAPTIKFGGASHFNNATFHQFANFSHGAFLANTEFDGARFRQRALFNHCRFAHYVGYLDTVFEERVDFSSAHFEGPTRFQRTNFKAFVPGFFEATLHEYSEWNESKWPKIPQGSDEALDQIQRYQCLARLMNDRDKFADQSFFFRKELRAQRRVEGWNVVGLMNLAYETICDYGFGLGRVMAIWSGHILGGAAVLLASKIAQPTEGESGARGVSEVLWDALLALFLSFGNAHGFLDLNRKFLADALKVWGNVPWFELVGATQTIFGVIILFFLILTIRNRFRMR